MKAEVWLRGPIEGVTPLLMPVVHALLQAREDLEREVPDLTSDELWVQPGGAASLGFHLRHIGGSIDRLLTYARGEMLDAAQLEFLALEADPEAQPADASGLLEATLGKIDGAIETSRTLPADDLLAERFVGRARLPSTTFGLLVHIAEHTTRHTGQLITTKKIVRGLGLAGSN